MKATKKLLAAVSTVAAASMVLSGCGGASNNSGAGGGGSAGAGSGSNKAVFDAASSGIVNPSTKTGGTLKLVMPGSDCDSWDPAGTYLGACWNLQRLFTRTLVGWQTVNGADFKLAPDLATDMGTVSSDKKSWTFTLKQGLKWSDGKPITPKDVKYGIERLFDTSVTGSGPGFYFTNVINAPKDYKGPYKSGDLPDSAISTTADSITFHLKQPFGDFDDILALPAAAPVPYKTEGGPGFVGSTYTKHPMSSGPFEIKSYTPNQSMDLVRNPNWQQSTDTIRKPLVNEVQITIDSNADDADQQLLDGTYDAETAKVGSTAQAKIVSNPTLKANADDPVSAFLQYFDVVPSAIPNADCRRAVILATNKAAIIQAFGGPYAGTPAGAGTPPGIPGFDKSYDPFPAGSDATGDLSAAKAALQKCGQPNGFKTKIAYRTDRPQWKDAAVAEQSALKRVGIDASLIAGGDASTYYSTFIGTPKNLANQGIGLTLNGWGADFPTAYGFWDQLVDGRAIKPTGNYNVASVNDPAINAILDKLANGTGTDADALDLNKKIMESATVLPIYWGKNLYYRNPRLTNVTSNNAQAFGAYDFVNIGVSQ